MSDDPAGRAVGAVFVAKGARTFCYGYLGILLPLYLADLGLSAAGVGASVTLTLVGSAALTWAVRAPAERYGARAALSGLAALSLVAALAKGGGMLGLDIGSTFVEYIGWRAHEAGGVA